MNRSIRRLCALLLAGFAPVGLSGCLFHMTHEMPPGTHFGKRPEGSEVVRSVEESEMKNYALAGLLPYSGFKAKDTVELAPGEQLVDAEIVTTFNETDTVIWVVPGFFYGYYLWAPRHVGVKGEVVRNSHAEVPSRH